MGNIGACIIKHINVMKWIATSSQIVATILLISPKIAALSIIPWLLYIIGALIWITDSTITQNKQLFWLSIFFLCWDSLTIFTRIFHIDLVEYINPMFRIIEKFI
jgi:hypothetical protein